jgi:N utilization substance protein B
VAEEATKHPLPNRRQLRVKIMQAIYAVFSSGNSAHEVFGHLLEATYKPFREAGKTDEAVREDAEFIHQLYYGTLKEQQEMELLITQKLEKWDLKRVALIDRILILMGLYELLQFPEIPIKVSINEYIEIAKNFSTEKSSQFVNGVLDAIQRELKAENKIKKVGRGLLENS